MNSVIFENEGLIDLTCITTMGVSVKSDSAIGYFGTGLKFSIATILRNNGEVVIYSGGVEYKFSTVDKEVKGQTFKVVTMNGDPLGFTTDLGKDWEPWMAVREIECNCQDEEGSSYETSNFLIEDIQDKENKTVVVVSCKGFTKSYRNKHEFILEDKIPFHVVPGLEIYKNPSNNIFYKGVKVYSNTRPFLYTYNFTCKIDLTEDRTLKYPSWVFNNELAPRVSKIDNSMFVNSLCTCGEDYEEYHIDYRYGTICDLLSARVRRSLGEVDDKIPYSLLSLCRPSINEELATGEDKRLNEVQEKQFDKARKFLLELGIYSDCYPVRVKDSLGDGILGLACRVNNTIYLSSSLFSMGTKYISATLYEEYIHLKYNVDDYTRGFQDHVINQLMTLGEHITEEVL